MATHASEQLHEPSSPPEARGALRRLVRLAGRPLDRFLGIEAASGLLLLGAAAVALLWANSPWADSYSRLWHTPVGVRLGSFAFERSLEWVVNDGLMVIFFFVVGLEIRHELHRGELSNWRRAALPAAAAAGGMIVPAALFLAFAHAPETRSGWGVPMATDIAFAIGVLTLLGKRVPASLRVLLLALAVIDDLGAILVIALFYSSGLSIGGFAIAALAIGVIFAMQRSGARAKLAYVAPAVIAWGGIYAAGVHPTIAGVIVGLVTPVRTWLGPSGFVRAVRGDLERLHDGHDSLHAREVALRLRRVDAASREALSPAESLIETLHPWVAFGIMPVFALANAGVSFAGIGLGTGASSSIALGTAVGLLLGKPLGILLSSWLVLRLQLATLPDGLTMRHLVVLGLVAGVGFTMALFIAQLAYVDPAHLAAAKLAVLVSSAVAGALGLALGRRLLEPTAEVARTADDTESPADR